MAQNDGVPHGAIGWPECEPAVLAWNEKIQWFQSLFADSPKGASTMQLFESSLYFHVV